MINYFYFANTTSNLAKKKINRLAKTTIALLELIAIAFGIDFLRYTTLRDIRAQSSQWERRIRHKVKAGAILNALQIAFFRQLVVAGDRLNSRLSKSYLIWGWKPSLMAKHC